MPPALLGIDLGGTKILAALALPDGTILGEREVPTPATGVIAALAGLCRDLAAGRAIGAVGLGVPGVVHPATGRVSSIPNVPELDGVIPADHLSELLGGVPVGTNNDVALAAMAEADHETGTGADSLAFLSLGTGTGLGLVLGGRPWSGASGAAGEIAEWRVADEGESRRLEDVIGSPGLLAGHLARTSTRFESVRALFDAAEAGEAAACATRDRLVAHAADALFAVRTLFDPADLVVGGSIGARPGMAERIGRRLVERYSLADTSPVRASRHGRRAGLVGALRLAAALVPAGV